MPPTQTIVRFTDFPDLQAALAAMSQISTAPDHRALALALGALSEALRFSHYLMLQFAPGAQVHNRALHNLATTPDLRAIDNSVAVANLLLSPLPLALPRDIEVPELQHGIAVSSPNSSIGCILFLGGQPAAEPRALADQQGTALVATSHLAATLLRLELAACPLPDRELQCLRYAALGATAKETARVLGISSRTVEEYIERSRARLGVNTTIEAVITTIRRGWITDDEIAALSPISSRRQYGAG